MYGGYVTRLDLFLPPGHVMLDSRSKFSLTLVSKVCIFAYVFVSPLLDVFKCLSVGMVSHCTKGNPSLWVTDYLFTSHANTFATDRQKHKLGAKHCLCDQRFGDLQLTWHHSCLFRSMFLQLSGRS